MSILFSFLLLVGLMLIMSKLGIGCCGGHGSHSEGHQSCCSGNQGRKSAPPQDNS